MISKSAATQFSVMIIESTGITESIGIITESTRTVRAYVTKHQLGKRFRRQFPSRQRLSFRWRLLSQQGLCARTKPGISWGSSSGDDFRVGRDSLSVMISEWTGSVCAYQSRCQPWREWSWLFLRRPLRCFRWRLPSQQGLCARTKRSSAGEAVSATISIIDYFWVVSYSVFGDDY